MPRQSTSTTVSNNGFNPRWDQEFEFHVSCPGNCLFYVPFHIFQELSLISFRVYDRDIFNQDDFIGQAVIPFPSLLPGIIVANDHIHMRSRLSSSAFTNPE